MSQVPNSSDGSVIQRLLPLKPVDYLILFTLVAEDRYGYAIVNEVERSTKGTVRLEPGNLYRSIRRLQREGLVGASLILPRKGEDERRRYYRITRLGREVLAAETARMRSLLAAADEAGLFYAEGGQ